MWRGQQGIAEILYIPNSHITLNLRIEPGKNEINITLVKNDCSHNGVNHALFIDAQFLHRELSKLNQ